MPNEVTHSTNQQFLINDPFGGVSDGILDAWFKAAGDFVGSPAALWGDRDFISRVNTAFGALSARVATQRNPHIFGDRRRVYDTARRLSRDNDQPTRPYLLLRSQFEDEAVSATLHSDPAMLSDMHNRPRQYLPSPLQFVQELLTGADGGTTGAYARAVVRSHIFSRACAYSMALHGTQLTTARDRYEHIRSAIAFDKVANSISKAEAYRKARDTYPIASVTDFIVGHILAAEGLAIMSFAHGEQTYSSRRSHEIPVIGASTFIGRATLDISREGAYEFRFSKNVHALPTVPELLNMLDGIPLPISGAMQLFSGGLRLSAKRGTIVRVSGGAGSGKTSFALSLAASLAPLGVITQYFTSEEDPEDLRSRLGSLVPNSVSRAVFPKASWFDAIHLASSVASENYSDAASLISQVIADYAAENFSPVRDSPPGLTPFMFVIDGVHELFARHSADTQTSEMHSLIEKLRDLGALVLILTAEVDEPVLTELDYIVDTVIQLQLVFRPEAGAETFRTLSLRKSRLQHAKPGIHQLHLSKSDGVKIYPSVAVQLSQFARLASEGPQSSRWYSFLQGPSTDTVISASAPSLLKVYTKSQVLIGGSGSTGKAAFALRLLTSEIVSKKSLSEQGAEAIASEVNLFAMRAEKPPYRRRNRILILSFLYQHDYYRKLQASLTRSRLSSSVPQHLDVINFYPGYLTAEIMVAKINQAIENARLDGVRYSSILIDGLHNMFLQFPLLEEQLLVWPVLFSSFRARGLTVVTTHTHFSLPRVASSSGLEADVQVATRRVAPLLHAIINAADFYIDISGPSVSSGEDMFPLQVVAALNQPVRKLPYFWNRSKGWIEFQPSLIVDKH